MSFKKIFDKIMNSFMNRLLNVAIVKKFINKETINYLIFGVLTTIVNYAVYVIVMWASGTGEGDSEYITVVNAAVIISWIFAVAFAYITNKLYVFESKSFKPGLIIKEVIAFVGARLFSLGCEVLWMNIVVGPAIGMNDKVAKILANVFVMIANYFFSKFFIFKNKKGN